MRSGTITVNPAVSFSLISVAGGGMLCRGALRDCSTRNQDCRARTAIAQPQLSLLQSQITLSVAINDVSYIGRTSEIVRFDRTTLGVRQYGQYLRGLCRS